MNSNGKRPSKGGGNSDEVVAKRIKVGDSSLAYQYQLPVDGPLAAGEVIISSGAGPQAQTVWGPSGGGGGVTDHFELTSIGTTSHAVIDSRLGQSVNPNSNVTFNSMRIDDFVEVKGEVQIGEANSSFILPNSRGTLGQYMRQNAAGIVSWADFSNSSYGELRITNTGTVPTTFPAANTWVLVEGPRTVGALQNFVLDEGQLRYQGDEPLNFHVLANLTWEQNSNGQQCECAITKNNLPVPNSIHRTELDDTKTFPTNTTTSTIVNLQPGESVSVAVQNLNSAQELIVLYMTLTIVTINPGIAGGAANPFNQSLNTDDAPTFTSLRLDQVIGGDIEMKDGISGSEHQLGMTDGYFRLQRGSDQDRIWDTQGARFNVKRAMWVQNDFEINPGPESVVLPQTRGAAGQLITADGIGSSAWQSPQYKTNLVYTQVRENLKVVTAPQSILNISGPEGLGSKTLPANSPLGTQVVFKCSGLYENVSAQPTTLYIEIGDSGEQWDFSTLAAVPIYFEIEFIVTLRENERVWIDGHFTSLTNNTSNLYRIPFFGLFAIDRTVPNLLDLKASFGSVGQSIATNAGSIWIASL